MDVFFWFSFVDFHCQELCNILNHYFYSRLAVYLDSLLIHTMFILYSSSGSLISLSLSSLLRSGEAHLILRKSIIKFSLALRFVFFSTFIAHSNAFTPERCLASHLNALFSHLPFHWSHQNSSTSNPQTFKPLELYRSFVVLEVPSQMLSFLLCITLALLHAPHWAPVSRLSFYYLS